MKRFMALILTVLMVVGGMPSVLASSSSTADGTAVILPDNVPSPWAYDEVTQAIVLGMVPSDLQNHWRYPVTRIEFAEMVIHFLAFQYGFSDDGTFVSKYCSVSSDRYGKPFGGAGSWWNVFCGQWGSFQDLARPEDKGYGNAAYALGIVNGRNEITFDPNSPITRQEAAVMLVRCYQVYAGETGAQADASGTLRDWWSIAPWAREDVSYLLELNVMHGSDGAFSPEGTYTKEQAVLTLLRLYTNAPVSRGNKNIPEL